MKHYLSYIAGEWVDHAEKIEVENPATGEIIATVACAGAAEIDQLVLKARCFADSGEFTREKPMYRARLLHRIADEIRRLAGEGVPLLVAENGKTTADAQNEFDTAANYFDYYAGMADKIEGRSIPLGDDYVDFTYYEPLGVSAQIVPWNFPVDLVGRSLAPALAAGNAVIVKTPELTPLAITLVAQACDNVGLPKGALSMVCGYGAQAGAHLVAHKEVDQIVFTGSVATGKAIMKAAADNATPCVMELGGKSAAVVFPDADLDVLMDSVDWGIFFYTGQVCSAMSRMIVHEDIHDAVIERLKTLAESQVIGAGDEAETTLTPLASNDQFNKVKTLCQAGIDDGGTLVCGGKVVERAGYFFEPTIVNNITPSNRLFTHEVFGPVLAVSTFGDEQEAWALANGTDFGLAAGIFTRDLNIAMRGSKQLKAGQIYVNEWFAGGIETPFGGVKLSGFGREKGQEALYSYVATKNIAIRIR